MTTSTTTMSCPSCNATLLADGQPLQRVCCAACGDEFVLGGDAIGVRTSREAVLSLLLGLCSLGCSFLAGLPAIILGVRALREIKRREGFLKGRGLAVAGIASGSVISLVVLLVVGTFLLVQSQRAITDPQRIESWLADVGKFDFPPGIVPAKAFSMFGVQHFQFADQTATDEPGTTIIITCYPENMGFNRDAVRQQGRMYVMQMTKNTRLTDDARTHVYTVCGKNVDVSEQMSVDEETGKRHRIYLGVMPTASLEHLLVIVKTEVTPKSRIQRASRMDAVPTEESRVTIEEPEVRRLFESFEPRGRMMITVSP